MTPEELVATLSAVERALDKRLIVRRDIVDMELNVVKTLYRISDRPVANRKS